MRTVGIKFVCALLLCAIAPAAFAQQKNAGQESVSHGISWANLQKFDKKYLQDKPVAVVLTPPLKSLLGSKYEEFMQAIKVNSPIEIENGVLIATGMMPHSGGDTAAAVFYGMKGELLAVLWSGRKLSYFGNRQLTKNPVVEGTLKEMAKQ